MYFAAINKNVPFKSLKEHRKEAKTFTVIKAKLLVQLDKSLMLFMNAMFYQEEELDWDDYDGEINVRLITKVSIYISIIIVKSCYKQTVL